MNYPYILENPIMIYDMHTPQADLISKNGVAIICPSVADITENLNGEYSLYIEHPLDNDGKWKAIAPFSIIKADGQLFRVKNGYTTDHNKVTLKAPHITYELGDDAIIPAATLQAQNASTTLNYLYQQYVDSRSDDPQFTYYDFSFVSYVHTAQEETFKIREGTLANQIWGDNEETVVAHFGGYVKRNNFQITLEGAPVTISNRFIFKYGLNLTGIKRTIDYTDFCNRLTVTDQYGHENSWAYSTPIGFAIPHEIRKKVKINTPRDDVNLFNSIGVALFSSMYKPSITYEIDIEDIQHNEQYADINFYTLKCGDYVRVEDEILNIYEDHVRVISTVKDCLTGKLKSVVLGNKLQTLTSNTGYKRLIVK